MTKQDLINHILQIQIKDRDQQIEYYQQGFLRQVEWNPPGYIWNIEKFQYFQLEDIQEIYDNITSVEHTML